MDKSGFAGCFKFFLGRVGFCIKKVFADGSVEKICILGNHADLFAKIFKVKILDINAANCDFSAVNVPKSWNKVDDCGFSASAGADYGGHFTGFYGEVDIVKDFGVFGVSETDVFINDIGVFKVGSFRIFRRGYFNFSVKIIENPCEKRKASGEIHLNVEKGFHRSVKAVNKSDHGGDGTDCKGFVTHGNYEISAGKIDEKRAKLGENSHHHAEGSSAELFFKTKFGDFFVDLHKALIFAFLAGEKLCKKRTAYA